MAKNLGDMVVRIAGDTADFDKALDTSQDKLVKFGDAATKLGKSLSLTVTAPLLAMGAGFLKLADTQLKAEAALTNAIRATGKETSISVESLKKYTAELQKVTTFGDEAQLSALALVQQLADLDEKGLKQVLPGLLDFSTAMGVDLQTAASLVGKTLGSSTNALARYGIEVDATATPTEKLAQITDALAGKFGGAAEAAAKAGLGPLTQLKNSAGDLGEEFGKILIPELNKLVGKLGEVVNWVNSLDQSQKELIVRVAGFAAAIGPALIGIGAMVKAAGQLSTAFTILNAKMLANPMIAAAAAVAVGVGLVALAFKKAADNAEEINDRRSFSIEDSMDDNIEALAKFKKEIDDAYGRAEKASGRRRDSIMANIKQMERQYAIYEDQIKVQSQLNDYVDEQELLQNDINKAVEKRTEELQKQEKIAEDAATREKIRRDGVKKAREDALAATILGLEQIENKTAAGYITRAQSSKEIEALYRKEIDALFLAGYAIGQLDPLTKQVSIGALRLAELIGKMSQETENYGEVQSRIYELQFLTGEQIAKSMEDRRKLEKKIADEELALIERNKQARIEAARFAYGQLTSLASQLFSNEIDNIELSELSETEKARKIAEIKVKQAKFDKAQGIIDIGINTAVAITKALPNIVLAGIIGALGAAQALAVASKPLPQIPQLADGGIVMPKPGGTLANVAEAGVPEIVGPIDKVTRMLGATGLGGDTTPVHLVVNMDSRPFLDKVFDATRNRTVLISAGAVV
jgi:TP901 family phage tail tape measure protein